MQRGLPPKLYRKGMFFTSLYDNIGPNLFALRLGQDAFQPDSSRTFSCFLIVQHTKEPAFIHRFAKDALAAGCRRFDLFGKAEPQWHIGVDEADIERLQGDISPETIAVTSGTDTIEEFVECLQLAMSGFTGREDFYLVYDDEELYREAVSMLQSTDYGTDEWDIFLGRAWRDWRMAGTTFRRIGKASCSV